LEDIVMKQNNILIQGLKKRTAVIGFVILLFIGGVVIFSDITKPHTFSDGDIISAGQMNENLDVLYAKVNELEAIIDDLDPPPGGSNVPVGTILPFGGDTDKVPEGWLLCDGSPYSISGGYSDLYEVIGGNYGYPSPGEFYVPDLRGMFLRGADNGAGVDPDAALRTALQSGGNAGDMVGSMQVDAFQGHKHSTDRLILFVDPVTPNCDIAATDQDSNRTKLQDLLTGYDSDGHGTPRTSSETRPKNVYVNFIIKY
jgi:microcystin-dependent protein